MFVMIVGTERHYLHKVSSLLQYLSLSCSIQLKYTESNHQFYLQCVFFHSQAVAQDNNPQLSTQLQQVTGLLGINMSHSEARGKKKDSFAANGGEMEMYPSGLNYICFMHTCIYIRPCCCM